MEAKLYDSNWVETWTLELNESIFGVKINQNLIHRLLMLQRSNARIAIAHTKSRSERNWSTRKIYKQKGTGRARAGTSRSPVRRKWWVAFWPRKERNFTIKMNKKERRLALLSLLSSKAKGLQIKVIDLIDLKEIKTKNISTIFTNMKLDSTLFSILPDNKNLFLISRNISNVKPILVWYLNPMDLLKYKNLVFTTDSLKYLEEKFTS